MTPPAADGGLPGPKLAKDLLEFCVDFQGRTLPDNCEAMPGISCGLLRDAAAWINAQSALLAEKDAALAAEKLRSVGDWANQRENDALAIELHEVSAQLAAATKRLASAEAAIAPFARLSVPKKPEGNAGFYSLLFADIEAARAWRDAKDGEKQP